MKVFFSLEILGDVTFKDVIAFDNKFLYVFWEDSDGVDKFLVRDDIVYMLQASGEIYCKAEKEIQRLYKLLNDIPFAPLTADDFQFLEEHSLEPVKNLEALLTSNNPKLREFVKGLI